MFLRTLSLCSLFALGAAMPAQNQLVFDYGTSSWGGRATLAGHANFIRQATFGGIDATADLGGRLNARVRINGNDREAFHAQGDLDGSLRGHFVLFGSQPAFIGTQTLSLGGVIRVGGATVFRRTYTAESTQTINLAPLNVYLNGDVRIGVEIRVRGIGLFRFTLGAGATADVDLSLTPVLDAIPSTRARLTANADAEVQGRAYVAVGIFGVSVGVRATLDFADPVASAYATTDFRTATGQVCWGIAGIILRVGPYVDLGWFGRHGFDLIDRTFPGTSGCARF